MLKFLRAKWWKYASLLLVVYGIVGGLLFDVPRLAILNETIRCLHFHVPMWFTMFLLYLISLICSIMYLANGKLKEDIVADQMVNVGLVFGVLGLITGAIWAKYTWGDWWHGDPKQNMTAIAMLIYFAYAFLRSSIKDLDQKARISAIYNIFAFFAMIVLIFVIPSLTDSLHPSNGGNKGFVVYDLDNSLRMVFYPATIGFMGIGLWLASFLIRIKTHQYSKQDLLN